MPAMPLQILQSVFGYPAFRGRQNEIVEHVTAGGSALVLMPTGGGKSLCYQVPALARDGVTVVISPLIALMQDQVDALARRDVPAAVLNSTLKREESERVEQLTQNGQLKLLYLSPERLATPRTLRLLDRSPVALFAIDEAHCISEWGHDFRPEYLELTILHRRYPKVPRLALTATADATTRAEIIERLHLSESPVFSMSFDRPNITYNIVEQRRDGPRQLLEYIRRRHAGETGVVYCQSRGRVEALAAYLDAHDVPSIPYHAGMSAEQRAGTQAWYLSHSGLTIVATIAFGMGIDKPDVRFVGHLDVPKSVEGYYQETGRAGRDGQASEVWLAYDRTEAMAVRARIAKSDGAARDIQLAKYDAMLSMCESRECRRVKLLAYFEETAGPCGRCDVCRAVKPETGWRRDVRQRWRDFRRAKPARATMLLDIESRRRHAALLKWRARVAREQAMPLHVVLHDVTMRSLAARPPQCSWSLRRRIGKQKAALYARALMEVITKGRATA
jgi:ATP-dependent DNA helicase RecQ